MSVLKFLFGIPEKQEDKKLHFTKILRGGQLPVGEWKHASDLLSVKGIQYRRSDVIKFAKLTIAANRRNEKYGLLLEREADNSSDANALKVLGICAGYKIHVGYVDRYEAARLATHYPEALLVAEFYSLFLSQTEFIEIRFFVNVSKSVVALPGDHAKRLIDRLRDELLILNFIVMADNKRSKNERELLRKYILARAHDLQFQVFEDDLDETLIWLKARPRDQHEIATAIERVIDDGRLSISDLSDLLEIFVNVDGKISVKSRDAMEFLTAQIHHHVP